MTGRGGRIVQPAEQQLAQALRSGLPAAPAAVTARDPRAREEPLGSDQELSRFNELCQAREALAATRDVIVEAKALVLCGLPYRRVAERSVVRRARLGARTSLTVVFTAVDPVQPLPFGADRALLGWIQTLAYQNPQIRFSSLTEFFRAFGISDSGREYKIFYQRLARLRGLAISVQLVSEDGDRRITMHPIKKSFVPNRDEARQLLGVESSSQLILAPRDYGFELDPDFFQYLRANPVPLPLPIMRVFHNSPKAWDFASLVLYRSFAARNSAIVSWNELLAQMASKDSAHRRLKASLERVLREIRVIYRDFPARFLPGQQGLFVEPWRPPRRDALGA